MDDKKCTGDAKLGSLPSCGNLAFPYIAMQNEMPPKYSAEDALTRGTLFPGLDLPFKNMPNQGNPYAGTPLGEVMALDFAVKELNLYLDTHKNDKEAFDMLKTLIALAKEAKERYTRLYGPICVTDLEKSAEFDWLNSPWPWEYAERTGR